MCTEAERRKIAFFEMTITPKIMGVFRKIFFVFNVSVRSTTVPNLVKI